MTITVWILTICLDLAQPCGHYRHWEFADMVTCVRALEAVKSIDQQHTAICTVQKKAKTASVAR